MPWWKRRGGANSRRSIITSLCSRFWLTSSTWRGAGRWRPRPATAACCTGCPANSGIIPAYYIETSGTRSSYLIWGTAMFTFLLWCILFVLCWPLAIAALLIYPIVWLLLLPFRLVGIAVGGALHLVWAIVMLPLLVVRRLGGV